MVGKRILPRPVLRCTVARSLREQQFLKLDTAVPYHCCHAVVCTGALISVKRTLPNALCSALLLVIQLLFEQRILTGELAVRHVI